MAAVGNLGVEQLRQLACDRLVLFHSPLQHRTRPTVARCDKEINLLASADEAVACVVSVQHHKARRANWVEREADIHLCRESLVCSIQFAGILVLVVQSNLLTVRQLSQLSDLLEPELISGELICEAGRPCCKLLGHVPHTISKLVPVKTLHGSECRALLGEIFMSIGEPGEPG